MLKGINAVTKRVSELPQSTKFKNWCVAQSYFKIKDTDFGTDIDYLAPIEYNHI